MLRPGSAAGRSPDQRAVVKLDDGTDVAYRDVRRFGTSLLLEGDEVEAISRSGSVRNRSEPLNDGSSGVSRDRRGVRRSVAPRRPAHRRGAREARARRSGRSLGGVAVERLADASVDACPSCPRSRPSAARLAPVLEGRRFERVEINDPRLVASATTRPRSRRARRASASRRRASRQVSDCSVRVGTRAPDSPPDDGVAAALRAGGLDGRSAPPCCCQARRRLGRRLPRRAPLRHVAPARAGRARAVPRRAPRRRAARRALHGGPPRRRGSRKRRAPIKAALLDQRTLAGIGNIYADEALWRARIHPLRPAESARPRRAAALARGIRAALGTGSRARARRSATTAQPDGGERRDAARVQGLRPRRRAVRPLWHADREDPRRRPRAPWFCPTCQPERPPQAASSSSSRPSRSRRQSSV